MLLFKRILNLNKPAPEPDDKRKTKRYPVGNAFPFKAVVILMGHDGEGVMISDKARAQAWAGRLTNLSEVGANIHMHSAALAHRGEPCVFKLSLDDYLLEFPGTVAHFRTYPKYTACGFSFNFPNTEILRAYLQLLEPVAIGAQLVPADPSTLVQDTVGLTKEQYQGGAGAILTIWRPQSHSSIYSFDFRMNAYGVRWSEGMTEVEPYGLSKLNLEGKKTKSPFIHLTDTELEDVRWLFCLAVPNLAKAVPLDVRKFLANLVA